MRAVTRWWSCGGSSACCTATATRWRTRPHPAFHGSMRSQIARAAGLPVDVHVDGQLETLSPGLDLVAYRVVQEALTNAIKHAGPARARVSVTLANGCLELAVSDNGYGREPASNNHREDGHGLVGMNERVRLYGGEVHAGPRIDTHGFEVHARLPLTGAPLSPVPLTKPAHGDPQPAAPARALHWR